MKTLATMVTERGQVPIPAAIRKQLNLSSGQRVTGTPVSEHECRMQVVVGKNTPAMAMLGYAARFRRVRRTSAWMTDLREGDAG